MALQLLPSILADLDAITDDSERLLRLVEGAFAGNLFDLGAANTADLFGAGGTDFLATRVTVQPRPWSIDDFDAFQASIAVAAPTKSVLFVDNSGSDFVLGMLPLARELLRRGGAVIIAANLVPSINDITAEEAAIVVNTAAEGDSVLRASLADGRLRVISSGSARPVIDLRAVSQELAAAMEGVDLVVLEGMGRSIETNLEVVLKVRLCSLLC